MSFVTSVTHKGTLGTVHCSALCVVCNIYHSLTKARWELFIVQHCVSSATFVTHKGTLGTVHCSALCVVCNIYHSLTKARWELFIVQNCVSFITSVTHSQRHVGGVPVLLPSHGMLGCGCRPLKAPPGDAGSEDDRPSPPTRPRLQRNGPLPAALAAQLTPQTARI